MIKDLTEPEAANLDIEKCPDCGGREFHIGPRGGMSINIQCVNCKAAFNVTPGISGTFGKERLSRPIIRNQINAEADH